LQDAADEPGWRLIHPPLLDGKPGARLQERQGRQCDKQKRPKARLWIAAVGLYGVIAHAVANRTAEIGIRMALGAERRDIVRLVMREGVSLTAALLVSRTLSVFLFGVGPSDPLSLWTAIAFVGAFGVIAALIPALGATRVDPLRAVHTP
jgi:ABC-type antimicrobial peptide transport system permease subunit